MTPPLQIATCCLALLAASCASRYVGPGSGTRNERVQAREAAKAESTSPVDPRIRGSQKQAEIDKSGIPVAP